MTTGASGQRFMGIDYGTKRIGVAISDEQGTLAFPKEIVPNDVRAFTQLATIIAEENISEIVVGESVDLLGVPNPLSTRIEFFISELEDICKLPIHRQREFLTSIEARKSPTDKAASNQSQSHSKMKDKKIDKVDASAAALILQRYLDKNNKGN